MQEFWGDITAALFCNQWIPQYAHLSNVIYCKIPGFHGKLSYTIFFYWNDIPTQKTNILFLYCTLHVVFLDKRWNKINGQ